MDKVYDFSPVFIKAVEKRTLRICTDAVHELFSGERICKEDFELVYSSGKCQYFDDVTVKCRGKVIMERKSATRTGFTQRYSSPIFKKSTSKSK